MAFEAFSKGLRAISLLFTSRFQQRQQDESKVAKIIKHFISLSLPQPALWKQQASSTRLHMQDCTITLSLPHIMLE